LANDARAGLAMSSRLLRKSPEKSLVFCLFA
jgi:hypothetical protein